MFLLCKIFFVGRDDPFTMIASGSKSGLGAITVNIIRLDTGLIMPDMGTRVKDVLTSGMRVE